MTDLAATIKSAVTMPEVARMYGYEPNWNGYVKCPFHGKGNERTPSLRVKEKYFVCYACKEHGTSIDFVMKLFNLSLNAACARLNADFHLGIDLSAPVDTDALKRRRAAREAQKRKDEKRAARYRRVTDEYRRLRAVRLRQNPASWNDMSPEFLDGLRRMDALEWWLDENEYLRR